jgi:hypothetical protein
VDAWLPRRRAARLFAAALAVFALAALLGGQGARLGPWLVPPLPATWLALGALGAVVLPPSDRPARARSLWAAALLLAGAAWPVAAWRQAVARPVVPVVGRVGYPDQPHARPRAVVFPSLARLRQDPPWHRLVGRREEFVLDLEVWVWAPRAGTYRLELAADDTASLEVDGRRVLESVNRAAADVSLAAGAHAFRLRHVQGKGGAHLALDWDRPAWLEVLPLDAYTSSRPEGLSAAGLRARHASALASLLAAWLWWAAAAVLVARAGESRHAWPATARLSQRVRAGGRSFSADPGRRNAVLVAAAAGLTLFALEALHRPRAIDGLYFQAFTSEYLMQTVSAADLRDEPWRSLFYLHIQPPVLDTLRALLVWLAPDGTDRALVRSVDAGLYVAWGMAYVALVALAARWLARLASPAYGAVAAALLALHPATVYYATLVDSTLLSATLLTWMLYELWRFAQGQGSAARLSAAGVLLFLTRSVFQWPFLVVLLVGLRLVGTPWRRGLRVLAPLAVVMALYVGKQYAVFGLTMTSTFAPDSFCKGIGAFCPGNAPAELPPLPESSAARVLSRTRKTNGEYNYNQLAFLRRSFSQTVEYRRLLRGLGPRDVLAVGLHNLDVYLRPSSHYGPHVIVDRLPWRRVYDRLFSGWWLAALVGLATASALFGPARVPPGRALGLALPALYVFGVTVLFESGENMRYKFFLEPVLFVFAAGQAYRVAAGLSRTCRTPASPAP